MQRVEVNLHSNHNPSDRGCLLWTRGSRRGVRARRRGIRSRRWRVGARRRGVGARRRGGIRPTPTVRVGAGTLVVDQKFLRTNKKK